MIDGNSGPFKPSSLDTPCGADLVFYCAILGTFAGFFVMFLRFRRLERDLTRIVRQVAIRGAIDSERDAATAPEER